MKSSPLIPLLVLAVAFVLASLFHAALIDATPKPLELRVSPLIGFAPLDLSIFIRLQPVASDRILRVVMDGESYSRASEWSLDGEQSPHQFRVEWRRVYAQEADVVATVATAYRIIRAQASQRVIVTSP